MTLKELEAEYLRLLDESGETPELAAESFRELVALMPPEGWDAE